MEVAGLGQGDGVTAILARGEEERGEGKTERRHGSGRASPKLIAAAELWRDSNAPWRRSRASSANGLRKNKRGHPSDFHPIAHIGRLKKMGKKIRRLIYRVFLI